MKKLIFAAFAAGAMVLAGCTKIEVKDVPESRAIGFDNFVSNAVKSPITQNSDLNKFYVFGGTVADNDIFNNQEMNVSWSSGDATVTYSPQRFWEQNSTYKFAAYSNGNKTCTNVEINSFADDDDYAHLKISDYTTNGTEDLIYAQSANAKYSWNGTDEPTVVEFTFYHILSNISFEFAKDAQLDDITVEIEGLTINSINKTGTFTGEDIVSNQYNFAAWSSNNPSAQSITFTTASTSQNGGSITSDQLYLIPQSAENLTISFTLKSSSDEVTGLPAEKTFTNIEIPAPLNKNWNPGFSYIYKANITAETFDSKPIVFDVQEVKAWETPEDIDIEDEINLGAKN